MISLFNFDSVLESIKKDGIHHIRCSETGAIISTMNDSAILRALEIEAYSNPLLSEEQMIDEFHRRWLIQSSRPAPHLTKHMDKHGFKFLRSNFPEDLFAILSGRLIFERPELVRRIGKVETHLAKMDWLISLQNIWQSVGFNSKFMDCLEIMVRLDAIHNVRHAFYDQKIKQYADQIRESEFNLEVFHFFLKEVEACGLIQLSKMSAAPKFANSMSLSAALDQEGLTPDDLIRAEERRLKIEEERRRVINAVAAKGAAKSGKVVTLHGRKALFDLKEVAGTMNPRLEEKYRTALEEKRARKAESAKPSKERKPSTKAMRNALARFGNLDIDF
jgi:hypothetical protein